MLGAEAVDSLPCSFSPVGSLMLCGIDLLAAAQDLEMQMRAGRTAGRADIGDDLALFDAAAGMKPAGEAAHMGRRPWRARYCA